MPRVIKCLRSHLAFLLLVWTCTAVTSAWSQAHLEVVLEGLGGDARDNVAAALSIYRRRAEGLTADAIEALHSKAEQEIRTALQPYGYYAPQISASLTPPGAATGSASKDPWIARYTVDPGPAVAIETLKVQFRGPGAEDPAMAALAAVLPITVGATFRHLDYERAKRELLTTVHTHGYPQALLTTHDVIIDMQSYAARVHLIVDTGSLHLIGPISFDQDRFSETYLAQYLTLTPGEPFDTEAIARQRRALTRSGHFQSVEVIEGTPIAGPQPKVPLTFHLTPFKANRLRGQLGWGTDTGIGLQADWNRRYIGRNGHRFTLGASAVEDQNRLASDLRYTIPLDPLTGERLELALRHQSRTLTAQDVELDEGGETRILNNMASGFWHFPQSRWRDFRLETRAGLSLVVDSYDIFEILFGNLPAEAQDIIAGVIGEEAVSTLAPDFETVVPSFRVTARRSDNDLYIRKGDYFRLELLGTEQALGSNVDFWQARFDSWAIRPIGSAGRILLRTSLGYSDAETEEVLGAQFNQMPEVFEFRAGGARSIRGYRFERLVPQDAITGGKHKLIGSVEYEHEVIEDISLAAFVDAGNAFNDWNNIDEKVGAGIGLRWRSPVGAIRIDAAFPLDDAEDAFQIYVTVGPEF